MLFPMRMPNDAEGSRRFGETETLKTITSRQLKAAINKTARHEMNPVVCKGCGRSHHYVLCVYDLLMQLSLKDARIMSEREA